VKGGVGGGEVEVGVEDGEKREECSREWGIGVE